MVTAPWRELFAPGLAGRALILAGGVTLHATNIFVAATTLPSIVADIGGLAWYAWSTTLYVVGSIIGSAASAQALDGFGARRAYRWAAILFGIGAAIDAIAPSMAVLLAGRTIQGFGGGMLFALGYAVIRQVLPQRLWPRGIALVTLTWGISSLFGPFIGGVFAEFATWRLAFATMAAATLLFILAGERLLPNAPPPGTPTPARFPIRRLALLALAVLVISGASVFPNLWINAAGIATALALLIRMARIEARASVRLLPSDAFRPSTPLGAVYLTMSLIMAGTSGVLFVPFLMQTIHGMTPLGAGYLAVLQAMGWTAGSMTASGAGQAAARRWIVAGPMVTFVGLVGLAFSVPFGTQGSTASIALVCLFQFGVGYGVGIGWPHLLTRVMTAAPDDERSLASSSLSTIQLIASSVASAIAGMIANLAGLADPGGIPGATNAALWLYAISACAPLLAATSAAALVARPMLNASAGSSKPAPAPGRD